MIDIPFLRPVLVTYDKYKDYLERIDSNHIYSNYGPINSLLEERIVREVFSNRGACLTVNNATIGLMLAIEATKRSGKFAIVPSFTFSATALAVQWCGLEPYFVDIDEKTWLLDEDQLSRALADIGDDLAVVLPYATFANCLDIGFYNELVNSGVPVVIDAASSLGTLVDEEQFGTGFKGPVVYSLHATKPYGIGEGGIVYSDDLEIVKKIRQMGNFGFDDNRKSIEKGLNAKLPEVMAAIGLAMLDELEVRANRRRELFSKYVASMKETSLLSEGWTLQKIQCDIAYQFLPILCPADKNNQDISEKLKTIGIEVRTYFSPACHQQPQFSNNRSKHLQTTDSICERIISLPMWDKMTDYEVKYITQTLKDV